MKNTLSDNYFYNITFENRDDESDYQEYVKKEGYKYLFIRANNLIISRFDGHAVPHFDSYNNIESFPCRTLEEGFNILLNEKYLEGRKGQYDNWTYEFPDQTSAECGVIDRLGRSLMHYASVLNKSSGVFDIHLSVTGGKPVYYICPQGEEPSEAEYKQGRKATIAVNVTLEEAINHVQNLGANENNINLSNIKEETLQAYYEANILYSKYYEKKADAELVKIMNLYNRLNRMGIYSEYDLPSVDVSDVRGEEVYRVFSEMKNACFSREDYSEFCRVQSCTCFYADSVHDYLNNKYKRYNEAVRSHYKVGKLNLLASCSEEDSISKILFGLKDRY